MITTVLLVKNGLPYLPDVLDAIFSQDTNSRFEVLAIDSGSTDGSLEVLGRYPVRVIQISPQEFNHGETRNVAAREADPESKYIVYLSQDALPADENWLQNLIQPMEDDPAVAGTFSRHIPRPNASPSLVRMLTTMWQTGGSERLVKQMPSDQAEYERDKFFYIYFSNTSSALRSATWEQIPFRRLEFAEDADWADRVLRAGHRIVYEPSSIVLHSHDYRIIEQFRQNVDHTEAMVRLFDPPALRDRWLLLKQLRSLPRAVWRDIKFMRRDDFYQGASWWRQMYWAIRSPWWYLASFTGGWVGARLDRLPGSWRVLFGRQERLKRGIKDR